jgi:hypothetical protein
LDLEILQSHKIGLKKTHCGGGAHVRLIISRAMSSVCWICVLIPRPVCKSHWNEIIGIHVQETDLLSPVKHLKLQLCNKLFFFFFGLSDDFAISCVSQVVLLSCEHLVLPV